MAAIMFRRRSDRQPEAVWGTVMCSTLRGAAAVDSSLLRSAPLYDAAVTHGGRTSRHVTGRHYLPGSHRGAGLPEDESDAARSARCQVEIEKGTVRGGGGHPLPHSYVLAGPLTPGPPPARVLRGAKGTNCFWAPSNERAPPDVAPGAAGPPCTPNATPLVGRKVFFGRPGQWFGSNDYDGDKVSIFHDLDGSITGYPDTFVGRANNYLLRHPGCLTVPQWNGVICTGRYAQLYIQARRPENLTILVARAAYPSHPLRLVGVNKGAPYQQYQPVVMLQQAYTVRWEGQSPREIILYPINFNRGDWLQIALCYPKSAVFQVTADIYDRNTGRLHSVRHYSMASSIHQALNASANRLYHFNKESGYLFLHLQAHQARIGHSYCSQHGCERIKITAHFPPDHYTECTHKPFPDRANNIQFTKLLVSQRLALPCRQCGAPQIAITSSLSVKYTKIQVQSVRREDVLNGIQTAFIKVDEELFLFKRRGLFFLVLDACSGTVVSKRQFEMINDVFTTKAISSYIQVSMKQRSVVLICSRDILDTPPGSEMSVFTKLGSARPIVLYEKGSFAMVGYKGLSTPSWINIINSSPDKRAASIQLYLPLMLTEYRCPTPKT